MPTVRLFKVGADPEFGFLDKDGEIVQANGAMTRVRSKFGLDGCSSIAEMRPDPSINPSQVVRNLYNDLLTGYYANPGIRELYWKAGSAIADGGETYATGGHIHFGIHGAITRRVYGDRSDYYRKLTDYLDCYLAQVVRLLDSPTELEERLGGEYGYLGDHRSNSHGVEYRVLGSWLTSPRIAEGVLCLAQTVAYQHMWLTAHGKSRDITLDRLAPTPETNDYDEYNGETDVHKELKNYRSKFGQITSDIRKFRIYRQHEIPIEFIFKLVEKNKTWYPGDKVDMKQAWGITTAPTVARVKALHPKALPAVRFEDIWKRARG